MKKSIKSIIIDNTGDSFQSCGFRRSVRRQVTGRYLLFLPAGYATQVKNYPAIFFLHGAGERGSNLDDVKRHGLPKVVATQPNFPFIVVAPQCPARHWWSLEMLDTLYEEVSANYRVDQQRIYLTGLSMGGFATWSWAIERPYRFAAIVPVCGGGNPLLAERIAHLPVWIFHGARDDIVPVKASQEMARALRRCGAHPKLTIYPEAGHDSWTETYQNPALYRWLLRHHKNQ